MTRSKVREEVFKMLFRLDFHDEAELNEQIAYFVEDEQSPDDDGNVLEFGKDEQYIKDKCRDVARHIAEIDAEINEKSEGWKTTRMGKVDLTIIRLAVYEIKFEDDIDTAVSINEAVELAKAYGTDDSSSFVNGILAKFA